MRRTLWNCRALVCVPVMLAAAGLTGCKSLSERYIAFEVWKYERCFGHLPPGFTPAGAVPPAMAAPATMRPCSQPCGMTNPCNACGSGMPMVGGMVTNEVGSPQPVRASKPVIISDEVVLP